MSSVVQKTTTPSLNCHCSPRSCLFDAGSYVAKLNAAGAKLATDPALRVIEVRPPFLTTRLL